VNTLVSTSVDEQHHPPSPSRVTSPRGVALADRVALHLGLALITWSRRPRRATLVREYNPHAHRERELARRKREEQWQRAMYVSRPWR
jgi:hypothetical protein